MKNTTAKGGSLSKPVTYTKYALLAAARFSAD